MKVSKVGQISLSNAVERHNRIAHERLDRFEVQAPHRRFIQVAIHKVARKPYLGGYQVGFLSERPPYLRQHGAVARGDAEQHVMKVASHRFRLTRRQSSRELL